MPSITKVQVFSSTVVQSGSAQVSRDRNIFFAKSSLSSTVTVTISSHLPMSSFSDSVIALHGLASPVCTFDVVGNNCENIVSSAGGVN